MKDCGVDWMFNPHDLPSTDSSVTQPLPPTDLTNASTNEVVVSSSSLDHFSGPVGFESSDSSSLMEHVPSPPASASSFPIASESVAAAPLPAVTLHHSIISAEADGFVV